MRQYIFLGAVLALLSAVLVQTVSEERIQAYFDRVEAIPGYKIELREQPLWIAMISDVLAILTSCGLAIFFLFMTMGGKKKEA